MDCVRKEEAWLIINWRYYHRMSNNYNNNNNYDTTKRHINSKNWLFSFRQFSPNKEREDILNALYNTHM